MTPYKHDFKCKAGTTWRKVFSLNDGLVTPTPIDLTGFGARMHVREAIDATTAVAFLATSDLVPLTPGDDPWGTITIEPLDGRVTLYLSDEVTSTIATGSYVYDVELVSSDGEVDCPLYGKFKVSGEVTR